MSDASQPQNSPAHASIIFTENAAKKVFELIVEEDNDKLNLRVFITGGGCSGFQYGFTFDEKINEDDMIIKRTIEQDSSEDGGEGGSNGGSSVVVLLLIDPMSFQYLVGAEIDFKKDVSGEQFIIRNPNAKTTCGCGSSFSA